MIRYTIKLTKDEVVGLHSIINKGPHSSQTFRTAYILLNCDKGEFAQDLTNAQISKVLKVWVRTIDRVKKKFIEEGFEGALGRRPSSRVYATKSDGGCRSETGGLVLQQAT